MTKKKSTDFDPGVDNSCRSVAVSMLHNYPGGLTFKVWKSEDLLCGGDEFLIQHGNDFYRLKITRSGGLILNK